MKKILLIVILVLAVSAVGSRFLSQPTAAEIKEVPAGCECRPSEVLRGWKTSLMTIDADKDIIFYLYHCYCGGMECIITYDLSRPRELRELSCVKR